VVGVTIHRTLKLASNFLATSLAKLLALIEASKPSPGSSSAFDSQ